MLHENRAWVEPLRAAFEEMGLPFEEWFLDAGRLDLMDAPPPGVFYNRMSASSHTRGHRYSPEYTGAVLAWLEQHGRRVVNSSRALQLEISKVAQYAGRDRIVDVGRTFDFPFITKHNRAGKGLGVKLFKSAVALERYVGSEEFEPSVDGVTLIQQYIEATEPFITRVEFVGGRLLYAVRVDTSQGFELCPADACRVDDAFCPTGESPISLFQIEENFSHELIERYEHFLFENKIHIAGIEFITDRSGVAYTYDVNTNTNYNSKAEEVAGVYGMRAVADYLGRELAAAENTTERRVLSAVVGRQEAER